MQVMQLREGRTSQLLPLLRSQTQADLLAWLYLHPDRALSLSELAGRVGVSPSTVMREVDRLIEAGLLSEERVGRTRLVRANQDTAVYRPLTDLLAATHGPLPVLTDHLAHLTGVDRAYIYGSWAARYRGERGPVPNDVDVLVVGSPDPDELFAITERAGQILGREVNARRITAEAWSAEEPQAFVASVRTRPLVELELSEER